MQRLPPPLSGEAGYPRPVNGGAQDALPGGGEAEME